MSKIKKYLKVVGIVVGALVLLVILSPILLPILAIAFTLCVLYLFVSIFREIHLTRKSENAQKTTSCNNIQIHEYPQEQSSQCDQNITSYINNSKQKTDKILEMRGVLWNTASFCTEIHS